MGGVDVSGWTLAQKMELPDWCFGNREVISVQVTCLLANTYYWEKSTIVLPATVAIWSFGWVMKQNATAVNRLRFGFRSAVPTSEAEMDTAIPILPYFGGPANMPPRISVTQTEGLLFQFGLRKGMATGGNYIVVEFWSNVQWSMVTFFLVYSELPTRIPAHLDPNTI